MHGLKHSLKSIINGFWSSSLIKNSSYHLFGTLLEAETPPQWLTHKFLSSLESDYDIPKNRPNDITPERFEPVYSTAKRILTQSQRWRYGHLFVQDNIRSFINQLNQAGISIKGKRYCDLGCGKEHPYGTSAIVYINGASSAIATDIDCTDPQRSAEALYELLLECLAHPNDYHFSDISREDYLSRIYQFNLKALREGCLQAGLENVPVQFVVTNIYQPSIEPESIDIMSSRAVLEHLLDFELACKNLYSLMSPGGIAYHHIDLADHRAYRSSDYHWWSFLTEDEAWSDGYCNRLRSSEIHNIFCKVSFEILDCQIVNKVEMPIEIYKNLNSRFAVMDKTDLDTLLIDFLIKKPTAN